MFHVFLLCSGLAAAVNIGCGYLLYGIAGLDSSLGYVFSVSCAFLSGMGVSFVLNRRFTYADSGRAVSSELPDFVMVSIGGLLLTAGMAHLMVSQSAGFLTTITGGSVAVETAAHVIAVGVTAIYSFFAHKHVSFRNKKATAANVIIPAPASLHTSKS